MKAELRISIKDNRRGNTIKVTLTRVPFGVRQYFVRMNGQRWPANGQPVSLTMNLAAPAPSRQGAGAPKVRGHRARTRVGRNLTRLLTALRKSLVKAGAG